jgi:integrase
MPEVREGLRSTRLDHAAADHEYKRDTSRPAWHGWHAFRRGLGTNLAEMGVDDLTIQRILRHANVATTRQHYIKVRDLKVEAAMKLLETALCAQCAPAPAPLAPSVVN